MDLQKNGKTDYNSPTPQYAEFLRMKKLYNWAGGTRRKKGKAKDVY